MDDLHYRLQYVEKRDSERIKLAERRNSNQSKEVRTERRNTRSDMESFAEEVEGLLYGAGIDNYWYVAKKSILLRFYAFKTLNAFFSKPCFLKRLLRFRSDKKSK